MVSANKRPVMMMIVMMLVVLVVEAQQTCTWLRKQEELAGSKSMFQVYSNNTISILRMMGNSSSTGEISDFPYRQYNHASQLTADDKPRFLVATLTEVAHVFDSGSLNKTTWDQTLVDTFNNDLYRQTSELQHCMEQMHVSPSHSVTKLTKRTKLHFKALRKSLKVKDYSASSWEDVRMTLLTHLLRLDLLAATL